MESQNNQTGLPPLPPVVFPWRRAIIAAALVFLAVAVLILTIQKFGLTPKAGFKPGPIEIPIPDAQMMAKIQSASQTIGRGERLQTAEVLRRLSGQLTEAKKEAAILSRQAEAIDSFSQKLDAPAEPRDFEFNAR
jgi:hypothetical protein